MKRIHILKPGKFRDMSGQQVEFTAADLADCAAAYDPTLHRAPIVVGHPKTDAPAYGWTKGLSIDADGLWADPDQVDPAFAEMVGAGRFGTVSASLFKPDGEGNPTPGKWALRHIGFLGAQAPAVKGLKQVELAGDESGLVTVDLMDFDDYTNAGLWRRMRDWLIGKFGQDAADQVIPDSAVNQLMTSATAESDDDSSRSRTGVASLAGQQDDSASYSVAFAGWNADRRQMLKAGHVKGGFAGPDESFPIGDATDVRNAWNLSGRAQNPDAVRRKAIALAKEHGWTSGLPATALEWAKAHSISLSEPQDMLDPNEAARKAELDARDAAIKAREDKIAAAELASRRAGVVAFAEALVASTQLHPQQKDFVVELMMHVPADATVDLAEAAGETPKAVNLAEKLKGFLNGLPKTVELGEHKDKGAPAQGGDAHAIALAAQDYVRQEAAKGNTISIAQAVAHVNQANG